MWVYSAQRFVLHQSAIILHQSECRRTTMPSPQGVLWPAALPQGPLQGGPAVLHLALLLGDPRRQGRVEVRQLGDVHVQHLTGDTDVSLRSEVEHQETPCSELQKMWSGWGRDPP